ALFTFVSVVAVVKLFPVSAIASVVPFNSVFSNFAPWALMVKQVATRTAIIAIVSIPAFLNLLLIVFIVCSSCFCFVISIFSFSVFSNSILRRLSFYFVTFFIELFFGLYYFLPCYLLCKY